MAVAAQRLPADFSDSGAVHSLASDWRSERPTASVACATDPIEVAHAKTQAPRVREGASQTEDAEECGAVRLARDYYVESAELNAFLARSTPELEEALHRNLGTTAFDNHDVSWEDERDVATCLHSLRHRAALPPNTPASVLESCTAVSWNATGSVVAAAYGPLDRNDWESSESVLCTWSVMRRQLDPSRADHTLQLPCCLVSLAFHRVEPDLLAGGGFNGDVMLFRLGAAGGEALACKSSLTEYTHAWPVLQLAWTHTPQLGHVLTSLSSDGRLLVWSPANRLAAPAMGCRVAPRAQAAAEREPFRSGKAPLAGGASLAFSPVDPSTFVVGFEAGQLLKCGLHANEARSSESVQAPRGGPEGGGLRWAPEAATLLTRVGRSHFERLKERVEREAQMARAKEVTPTLVLAAQPPAEQLYGSPASLLYQPHSGPVYGVAFSPFHRHVFLSVSTDASARLFSLLSPQPLLVTEPSAAPLYSCSWSPARPSVFAVGGADGQLHVYDLRRSRGKPELALKVTGDGSAVYAVAFNPAEPSLIATADGQGIVKIWRLSRALSSMAPREQEAFDRLAGARTEEAAAVAGEEEEEEEKRGGGGERSMLDDLSMRQGHRL